MITPPIERPPVDASLAHIYPTTEDRMTPVGTPPPEDACAHCDHPRQGHGVRYAALPGRHTWCRPTLDQSTQRRDARGGA